MDQNAAQLSSPPPHHTGHRDRLRERFVKGGVEALADYEILELILFLALPRRDVKPLAKKLIQSFGSFNGVFHSTIPDLVAFGLSENTAIAIKTINIIFFFDFIIIQYCKIIRQQISLQTHQTDRVNLTAEQEKSIV